MSSLKMTFSLTSLILIFALAAMPAMAAPPTFDSTPPSTINIDVGENYEVLLPAATDPDNGGTITYTLAPKTTTGDNPDPAFTDLGFAFTAGTRLFSGTGQLPTDSLTGASGTYVYTATTTNLGTESGDPEAVTHEIAITVNSTVSFGGATISDIKLKDGDSIDRQLPTATDSRTGVTIDSYTLTPDVADIGLVYTAAARHLGDTAALSTTVENNDREYTYTATAGTGATAATAELKFKITVVADSDPVFPAVTISDITGTVGEEITRLQLPAATDADGDMITYNIDPDLPAGLTIDMNLRLIEGTPTAMTMDADGNQAAVEYTWSAMDADGPMGDAYTDDSMKTFMINIMPAPPTAPDTPAAPTAMINATNDLVIDVSWTAPGDGGSAITGYTVKKYEGTTLVKTFPETSDPAITDTMLPVGPVPAADRGKSFTFTVTATNAVGDSAESSMSDAVMVPIAQPSSVTVAPNADGDAYMVSWTPPTENAGIMGYYVSHNPVVYVSGASSNSVEIGTDKPTSVSVWSTADSADMSPTAPPTDVTAAMADAADLAALPDLDDGTLPVDDDIVVTLTLNDVIKVQRVDLRHDGLYDLWTEIGPSTGSHIVGTVTSTDSLHPWDAIYRRNHEIRNTFHDSGQNEWNFVIDVTGLSQWIELSAESGYDLVLSDNPDTDASDDSIELRRLRIYVDRLGPTIDTIAIGTLPAGGGRVTVNIHFDEPLSSDPTPDNFDVKNGTISNIRFVQGSQYVADVTPDDGVGADVTDAMKQSVEIRLKAGLMDEHGNASVATAATATADGSFTPVKATTDTTTPTDPTDPTVTDNENILSGFSIPAETHVVIARDGVQGLPSGVTPIIWNGMPDLEELFFDGGTLSLTRDKTPKVDHDNDDADADGKKDSDTTKDASATRDIGARDVVITEVMAALNDAAIGTDAATAHQWIEVYNKLKVDVGGLTLSAKADRPVGVATGAPDPTATDSTEVLVDRLSNVVGGGWAFDGLGANGFSDDDPNTTNRYFVSFYRNNRGEPGWQKNRWTTSTAVYLAGHKGTPGAKERAGTTVLEATTIPRSPVIFNEIANRGSGNTAYEWIELRNVSDADEANLKNWQISIVTAVDSDKEFFNFYDKDIKIPAGGVLLLVTSDPSENPDHPLAAGFNIEKGADNQANGINADSPRYLIMAKSANDDNDTRGLKSTYADGDGLPNNGEFVLILRNGLDKEGKAEKLIDIAGYDTNLSVDSATAFTGLWPLVNYPKPDVPLNKLEANKVHRRQHAGIDGTRTTDKKDNADHGAFRDIGWTGIGYKRNATPSATLGGTPGYSNGALKSEGADAQNPVIISEIMFDNSRNFTQWIELHNTSKVHGMDINNWSIFIVNHSDNADGTEYAGKLSERIDLDGKIPPGQTYLIVSRRGSSDTKLPAARIHSANKKRSETILNPYGFQITLKAKTNEGDAAKHQTVDMVGNLAPKPATSRRADAQSFLDPAWMLPEGTNDSDNRVSINRVGFAKDATGANMDAASAGRIVGTKAGAWIRFDMSQQISLGTYYGHDSDIGSPGYTTGGVLPVSLSKFRPERLKDTGEVVVLWITESETNNAGFNILRSEKRDGAFTKVHFVAGQGTTTERTLYEWKDKSAKPNVVYYYQIQDISLDGDVTTLRTTHLRGNVTAVGKATTTWGEIKALQ